MTSDRRNRCSLARIQARRASDELLIEAIFGDILLARAPRTARATQAERAIPNPVQPGTDAAAV